jgi:hypothetical protein
LPLYSLSLSKVLSASCYPTRARAEANISNFMHRARCVFHGQMEIEYCLKLSKSEVKTEIVTFKWTDRVSDDPKSQSAITSIDNAYMRVNHVPSCR